METYHNISILFYIIGTHSIDAYINRVNLSIRAEDNSIGAEHLIVSMNSQDV